MVNGRKDSSHKVKRLIQDNTPILRISRPLSLYLINDHCNGFFSIKKNYITPIHEDQTYSLDWVLREVEFGEALEL